MAKAAAERRVIQNRVKQLRLARGLTQDNLAALLGVSRQTVNAIENGRYEASLGLAFDIARVFAANIEDIFRPAGDKRHIWSSIVVTIPTKLDAGRVVLRPHRMSDLAAFQRFLEDAEATRYMAFTTEQKTSQGAQEMMDAVIASYSSPTPICSLTIADPASDEYLGSAGGAEAADGKMEVFVTVMPEAQGQGIAEAAMRALASHLFNTSGVGELIADVVDENVASVRLFEKLGYRKVGPIERAATEGEFAHRDMQGIRYVLSAAKHRELAGGLN